MPVAGAGQIEFEIKEQIYCELTSAVQAANKWAVVNNGKKASVPLLPKNWGAAVSLSLEVDESSALNPGVTFNDPMANAISTFGVLKGNPITTTTPQLFSLGVGGTLSSTATRIDKFDPYYTIADLSIPVTKEGVCNNPENDPFVLGGVTPARSSPLIASDLGLTPWLLGALFTNNAIPSVTALAAPKKTQLEDERRLLGKSGFTSEEITQILASGADSDDVTGLEQKGYTHAEIAKFLSEGAYPPDLLDLKDRGYTAAEISTIVASKAKASGGKQAGSGGGGAAPDTISIEIKFIIVTNGNVTPTWKLLRVSANTGSSPLFGTGRTRTHDLIITIGPNTQATQFTHLASQIGNAVANDNRSGLAVTNPGF